MVNPATNENKKVAAKEAGEVNSYFQKKFIVKHTLWFALITVATIAGIFFYNHTGHTIQALKQLKLQFILICCVMLFADLMMGSWRNHIYVRKLKPELSHWVSFKANVVNMFMGAVTPAHGGAGPAQIYMYMRHGLSFTDSFAISLINFGATLIFMPLAGLIAILVADKAYVNGIIPSFLKYGFTFFSIFLVFFLLAFWKPSWVGRVIKSFCRTLAGIFPRRKARLNNWASQVGQKIMQYQNTCSIMLRKNPYLLPLSILITVVMYGNKYCMQYVILQGLGLHPDLWQVVSIQVLIQFIIYFMPTPGGSGVAELSISVLFAKIVPQAILPLFTLLQRSFLLFFPAILGAFFVLRTIHKQAEQMTGVKEKPASTL